MERTGMEWKLWWKTLELDGYCPELDGDVWKTLEHTCIIHVLGLVDLASYPCCHV